MLTDAFFSAFLLLVNISLWYLLEAVFNAKALIRGLSEFGKALSSGQSLLFSELDIQKKDHTQALNI